MGTKTVHETLGDWSDGFGFLSCPNLEFYTKPNHPSNTKRKQHLQTWNFQVSDPSVHPSFRKLLNNMFQQNKREVWDRGREIRQNPEAGGRAKTRWQLYRSLKVNHFGLEGGDKDCEEGSREEKWSREDVCDHLKRLSFTGRLGSHLLSKPPGSWGKSLLKAIQNSEWDPVSKISETNK